MYSRKVISTQPRIIMFEAGRKCEVSGERLFPPVPFLALRTFIYGPYGHAIPALGSYESYAVCVAYVILTFDVVNITYKNTCNDLMLWKILPSQKINQRYPERKELSMNSPFVPSTLSYFKRYFNFFPIWRKSFWNSS